MNKNKIVVLWLWIISRIRLVFEPLNNIKNVDDYEDLDTWENNKWLEPFSFSYVISQLPFYQQGFWRGSFNEDKPQIFFKDVRNRNSASYSRIWAKWYKEHEYNCEEWLITSRYYFHEHLHFVTIAQEQNGWRLLDFQPSSKLYETKKKALINGLAENWIDGSYTDGNLIAVRYRRYIGEKKK